MDLPYYKINKLLWRWSKKDGARIVRDVALSLDRPPPAREEPKPPPAPAPKKPKPQVGDGLLAMMELHSRFKTWLETPDPPKPPKHVEQEDAAPEFDIQEIPAAMRREMMPVGARLMERWFAGRLNYSPTDHHVKAEINQDGEPYPPDMYDTTTVKLDWILKFARAKEKYDYLITQAIRSPKAIRKLTEKLTPYKDHSTLLTTHICGNDSRQLHELFQFQYAGVDGTLAAKIKLQLVADVERSGVPDDLTAALGSFNIYAAIGAVRFSPDIAHGLVMSRKRKAEITGIWVYVADGYTFTDEPDHRSQYLGHWSSDGVIVIPLDGVAAISPYIPYVESPVTIGNPVLRGEIHYPIHNSDFRQWQTTHRRGGDFIVYTDRRFVPVNPAITLDL
jgi:hypothetical protein